MPALRERQAAILRDLTGPGAAEDRPWRIHRNTIWRGIIDALADAYPIFRRVVGHDFFEAMAREFVSAHPPSAASLILYGAEFPDFAQAYAPLGALPYAADLARLERAWLEAYHAADAAALTSKEAAQIDPETLMASQWPLHPACRLIASPHPIDVIWQLHQQDDFSPGVVLPARAAHILVCRPEFEVIVQSVPQPCFEFLAALLAGANLGDALMRAGGVPDALPHLQRAIALGLLTSNHESGG